MPVRRCATLCLGLILAGCGGGAPPTADSSMSTGAPESPTTPAASAHPGIASYTTIDPDHLDQYAATTLPAYYRQPAVRALDNSITPITDAGATLGRVLFHDVRLSVNGRIACASCHAQADGFTDRDRFSRGFEDGLTTAHAMRLANARWYAGGGFFWDKRAVTLEDQATMPISHPVEMGFDDAHGGLPALIARMDTLPYYPELFSLAFGDATITVTRIQQAIAQYVRSIASTGSRWDAGYAATYDPAAPGRGLDQPLATLSAEENRGRQLFMRPPQQGGAGCAGCHMPPTYSLDAASGSNGLDAGETTIFKSPSLKNVAVSGPYMHDGRFQTLAEVVDHYADGIEAGPALDQRLRGRDGRPQRLNLSAADRQALVAFLGSLTDTALLGDLRFTNPFTR